MRGVHPSNSPFRQERIEMQIQQLIRTDPERILLVVQNSDGGGSITTGMAAAIVTTAASGDGNQTVAVAAGATTSHLFVGVALRDIAINAFGLVTAWGHAASVALSQSVGSWTITTGDTLAPGGDAGHFTSVVSNATLSQALYRYVIALGAIDDTISNPRSYMSGFVRAL